MASQEARFASYKTDIERSTRNLQKAREDALKTHGYQSAATRLKLHTEFSKRNEGMVAYEWQIDVSEALLLGLDCSVIAGTGAGKTMPFVMPLFVESEKIMIVISPLNALEEDQVMHFPSEGDWMVTFLLVKQASRFKKMGLSAVAVNGDTYNNDVHKVIMLLYNANVLTRLK
jgi:ATP-dependent helicase YprA (DUF1998 family)